MPDNWQQSLIELLLPTAYVWRKAASRKFDALDLTASTGGPLLIIRRLGEGISQGTIAREAGVDQSAIVRVLSRMEETGLIERRAALDDRRRNGVYLTERGQKIATELETTFERFRDQSLENVSAEDGVVAARVLRSILEQSTLIFEGGQSEDTN